MSAEDAVRMATTDEASMRADSSKQRRYEELLDSPLFTEVVAANPAYLAAAVPDPTETERDYWTMLCLPSRGAFSCISIATMETFFLYESGNDGTTEVKGFVVVRRSVLAAEFGSVASFSLEVPDLRIEVSSYCEAGDDQVRLRGAQSDLVRALQSERFGAAARELAEPLL